jgi:hypothetical protein
MTLVSPTKPEIAVGVIVSTVKEEDAISAGVVI